MKAFQTPPIPTSKELGRHALSMLGRTLHVHVSFVSPQTLAAYCQHTATVAGCHGDPSYPILQKGRSAHRDLLSGLLTKVRRTLSVQ